ncbi:ribonuclease H-like domain-containing protein [Tanacetum coccineum]
MAVPNLEGTGYTKETICVEYECEPPHCSTADDEGFIEVKIKKSCVNNGGNKNFKPISVKQKTFYRPKAKQSAEGTRNSSKTTPFVDTNKISTSGNNKDYTKSPSNKGNGFSDGINLFSLSNSFEALNDENLVIEEVRVECKLVLVDDNEKPLVKVDYPGNTGSDDEVEQVDNETASYLASKPMGVGYGTNSLLEQLRTICDDWDIKFEHEHVVMNPTSAGMRHHHLHLYVDSKNLLDRVSSSKRRVKDAFAIVSREDSHKGIASSCSGSADNKKYGNSGNTGNNRGHNLNLLCTNCGKVRNTIDRCFDLIGYPPSYNKNHGPKQNGSKTFNDNSTSTSNEKGQYGRLSHPSNQAVDVLQSDLNFTKDSHISPCDICHKDKQTREPFPLSDQKPLLLQNGIAERKHIHLFPSSILNGKSPFELVYGLKPKLSYLRSFRCLCFSSVLNNSNKFSARSEKCVLIGFSTTKKAYKVYSLESKLVFYSRDIKIYETIFPFKMNSSLQSVEENCDTNINNLNFFNEKHFDNQTSLSSNDDGRVNFTPNDKGNDYPCTRSTQTFDGSKDSFVTSWVKILLLRALFLLLLV